MPDGGTIALKVRVGTPDDVHPVMELAQMGAEENGFMEPNPAKLLVDVWAALNLDHGIMGLIGDPGARLEGAVLLRIAPVWYGDLPFIEERAIYVHPEYRNAKGGRAARLVEFSKTVSDNLKMPLMIGVLSNHRTEAKVRLYERMLGQRAGAIWLYNGSTIAGKEMPDAS